MRQIALIEDRLTKQPFAVLVLSKNSLVAYGATGQGEVWANWANGEKMSLEQMKNSLDITLSLSEMSDVDKVDIASMQDNFSEQIFGDLKNEIAKKSLVKIIQTKNLPPFFPENANHEDDFDIDRHAEEESIIDWPLTDSSLASIDVAYKQIAVNYKSRAFRNDISTSSMALKVKGVRAVWDSAIPGGGGWRCPEDTPFGGQFTNRLGIGCTFGMMRRLGQGLTAASIRDIKKPITDPKNIDKPMLYRAGRRLESGAEARRQDRLQKFERRVSRRVEKLAKQNAKDKLRQGAPSARTVYSSLNPSMARRDRARIAAGTVIARVGNDMREQAFNAAMTRRAERRIPKDTGQAQKQTTFKLDNRIPSEYRVGGGMLPKKLSNEGLLLSTNGTMLNFDSMQPRDNLYLSLGTMPYVNLDNIDGNGLKVSSLPAFLTQAEIFQLESIARNYRDGTDKPLMTIEDVRKTYLGTLQPGLWKSLTREEAEDFLSADKSMYRIYTEPDWTITDELRTNGGTIPSGIANNGIYYNDATGEMFDYQTMLPTANMAPNERDSITMGFGYLPAYISPNEYYGMAVLARRSIADELDERARTYEPGRRLDPRNQLDAAIMGEATARALMNGRRGRRGPSKRAMIAARLRESAQDIREPGRRSARRQGKQKLNKSKFLDDKKYNGVLTNAARMIDTGAGQLAPNIMRGRIAQPTPQFAYAKGYMDDILTDVGIKHLSSKDSDQVMDDIFNNSSASFHVPGNMSQWDEANPDDAQKVAMALFTAAFIQGGANAYVSENYRNYGNGVIRERLRTIFSTGDDGKPRIRGFVYEVAYPRNQSALSALQAERTTVQNTVSPDAWMFDSNFWRDHLAESNWFDAGKTVVMFDTDGQSLLQVAHYGVNPPVSYGDLANTSWVTGNTLFTNGVRGAMQGASTYTTKRGADKAANVITPSGDAKRKKRGSKPAKSPIVQRFGLLENINSLFEPPTDKERAIREMYGRRPRPTNSRRERAANMLRRTAKRIRKEPVEESLLPQYRNLADFISDIPMRNVPGVTTPSDALAPRHFFMSDSRVHPLLLDPPGPAGRLAADWRSEATNFDGLINLNRMLMDPNRQTLLPDSFDEEHQDDLQKAIDKWSEAFNDPNQPTPQGAISNFKLLTENNDGIGNSWKYSSRKSSQPPVYIELADGSAAHFMDDDGNHIASAVEVVDANGNSEIKYIASEYTKKLLTKEPEKVVKPSFIQRVRGKFRKPKQDKTPAPSMRARSRAIVYDNKRFGLRFAKTTTGPEMPSSLGDVEKARLKKEMLKELDYHAGRFAKALGIKDVDATPIKEGDVLDWIAELKKTDPKRAGIEETNLHNFIVLSQFANTEDFGYVSNLKPSLRRRVMTNSAIVGTPVDEKKPRPFTPYGRNSGYPVIPIPTPQPRSPQNTPTPSVAPTSPSPAPSAPPVPSTPSAPSSPPTPTTPAAPVPVQPSKPVVAPQKPIPKPAGTGPVLTPGVGNPSAGITFDAASGLYIDTNTGEFVEDLSNLPIDQHAIYTPKPLEIDSGPMYGAEFPTMPVDIQNTLQKHVPHEVIAPGVDPTTPTLDITATPKTAASKIHRKGVISSFTEAIKRRIAQHDASPSMRMNSDMQRNLRHDFALIDATMALSPTSPLSELKAIDAKNIAIQQALQNPLLTDPLELMYVISPNQFLVDPANPSMSHLTSDMSRMGIDPALPIGEFYLPMTARAARNGGTYEMVTAINTALQLEHASNNPPAGMSQTDIADLRKRANLAWSNAANQIGAVYSVHQRARDNSLTAWRRRRMDKKQRYQREFDDYIYNGVVAERAQYLLEKHITNNPNALAAIEASKREAMEDNAKRKNQRLRLVAARQAAGLPRNSGLYDNQPDILDPWNSPSPPPAPRKIADIARLRDEHRSQTLFQRITQGVPAPLTDEQFQMLDILGEMHDQVQAGGRAIGPANSPLPGATFYDVTSAHLGMVWQYNGFNSLPVLLSREEIIEALKEVDANGSPKYVAISRGLGGKENASAAKQLQMVTDALTGDRFIPGQGQRASGTGEYWAQNPSSWSSLHGKNGGTMVALLSKDMILTNRKPFGILFGPEGSATNQKSITYESLWSLYNGFGAPGARAGVNVTHGTPSIFGIPPNSLKPDPNTGQLSATQLTELDGYIDQMTQVGTPYVPGQSVSGWGQVTLEGMYERNRLPSELQSLFPSAYQASNMSQDELDEIEDTRNYWNAWLHQRLVMGRDIVSRLENESTGGQSAKDANAKVWRAFRSHLYTRGENIATMMGYDGFIAQGAADELITPSQLWKALLGGRASRITILNRSAMIIEDRPIKNYPEYAPILTSITYPDGSTAARNRSGW
jgi:hypothetical protein